MYSIVTLLFLHLPMHLSGKKERLNSVYIARSNRSLSFPSTKKERPKRREFQIWKQRADARCFHKTSSLESTKAVAVYEIIYTRGRLQTANLQWIHGSAYESINLEYYSIIYGTNTGEGIVCPDVGLQTTSLQ